VGGSVPAAIQRVERRGRALVNQPSRIPARDDGRGQRCQHRNCRADDGCAVGKTELINNVVGYHIHQDPAPMLVVQPTLEMAQTWSKDRLAPAVRDTPVLASRIKDPRSRDSGNTTLHKVFAGGHVTACGANSPSSLASRPCRLILCDEVDRYPPSAGTEGDPVSLAKKRSTTFWNRKIILVSTPTEKNHSRIEQAYQESDQRKYFVKCPECEEDQVLRWANVHWEKDKPGTANYVCEHCGCFWDDAKRFRAIRYGKWKPTADGDGKTAGFHLSGLYSPWTPLEDSVRDFLASKRDPMRLKTWVNTFLGETWEDQGEQVDEHDLINRSEDWGEELPDDVLLLTAGVDVQDDRLELEIVGWGVAKKAGPSNTRRSTAIRLRRNCGCGLIAFCNKGSSIRRTEK
jgi:phage terminase large subunit GpA-like protein